MENCDNCGTPLNGAYCSACGQRALHHGLDLKEFLADAAEVITHADSRFWRTFLALLGRPGFLTEQYIKGRRASYLPPFRLYLVLSVLFFLVVPLTASESGDTRGVHAQVEAPISYRAAIQKELDASTDPHEKAELQSQLQQFDAVRAKLTSAVNAEGVDCKALVAITPFPPWLAGRTVTACNKIQADHGRELGLNLLHNMGRAMFVLLPLLAALMMLLYWHPHRHYVEHLLLLLHNHAFIFIVLIVLMIANRLLPEALTGWFNTILVFYMLIYLYQSMRRVYGQRWFVTFMKFCALGLTYAACAMLMLLVTTIYSAATL